MPTVFVQRTSRSSNYRNAGGHLSSRFAHALAFAICISNMAWCDPVNVVFVSVDDLNDWIGCLGGHPQAYTPNFDRLAKRGVLFTNAHCGAPACNPSRAAVYSGLMPDRTGVWSNQSPKLPAHRPDLELLPTALTKAGYLTLGTGKLLHGGAKSARPVFETGFYPEQRWSPLQGSDVIYTADELPSKSTDEPQHVVHRDGRDAITLPLNGMPSDRRPQQTDGESFDWGPFDVPDQEMGDTQITNWAIDQIENGFTKPCFLGVGYYRPHIPLWAPRKYFERFNTQDIQLPDYRDDDLSDLSETARKWAIEPVTAGAHETVVRFQQWQNAVRSYLACVTYVDHEFGRLLDAIDDSEYADNTLIILWSDHGWHLGEKQHWGKWTGWERSTRVPLIVVPPKNQARSYAIGQRCNRPVNLIDLFPTVAEFCQVTPQQELDGRSLMPLLKDPNSQPDRISITVFDQGNVTLRSQAIRYIRYADGAEELYDHIDESHEWTNLIADPARADRIQHARQQSKRWQSPSP